MPTAASDGPYSSFNDLDTPIYRIHPFRYLADLLAGKLVLPSTEKWTEPYENLPFWCFYRTIEAGRIKHRSISENRLPAFGQCWTTTPESDAMWRIYSRFEPADDVGNGTLFTADEGVRLRTTPRKLLHALSAGMGSEARKNCYITRVNYLEDVAIRQQIADRVGAQCEKAFSGVQGNAEALMTKRIQFLHENEVRLLYIDGERTLEGRDTLEVPINVNDVIEEIMLDPRLRPDGPNHEKRKQWLKQQGYKNEVSASMLYIGVIVTVDCFTPEEFRRLSEASPEK